jgi:hypothetical protein
MIFDAWTIDNISAVIGWLMALAFQCITFLNDIINDTDNTDVSLTTKTAEKRAEAFKKLMKLTEEPK